MRLRLLALFVVAALGCVAASSGSRSGANAAPEAARLPALPQRGPTSANRCPVPQRFRAAFERAATDTGFPLALLVAVAEEESQFRADARSAADARGLLQVLPTTGRELKLDVDRPRENVLAGARYLKLLLDEFQSTDLMLAAYNAGPGAVARAGGAPDTEVLQYVENVQQRWRTLQGCG